MQMDEWSFMVKKGTVNKIVFEVCFLACVNM